MHKSYIRLVPGAKTAVLLVHGIVGTPRHFDFLLDAVPPEVSVMNILLPGHGGRVEDFAKTSMKAWKQTVADGLAQLCRDHQRVIVVGHSMGTLLTAEAAELHPQVCGALFLNVPLRVWVAPCMTVRSLRWCFGKLRPQRFEEWGLGKAAGVTPDKRLWRYLAWLPRFWELLVLCRSSRTRFETMRLPAVVFQSHHDELVRRSTSRHLLKNSAICHTMLPGCGHFAYTQEARRQMRTALQKLLKDE